MLVTKKEYDAMVSRLEKVLNDQSGETTAIPAEKPGNVGETTASSDEGDDA